MRSDLAVPTGPGRSASRPDPGSTRAGHRQARVSAVTAAATVTLILPGRRHWPGGCSNPRAVALVSASGDTWMEDMAWRTSTS